MQLLSALVVPGMLMRHPGTQSQLNLGRIGVSHHLENFVSGGAGSGIFDIVKMSKKPSKMRFQEISR